MSDRFIVKPREDRWMVVDVKHPDIFAPFPDRVTALGAAENMDGGDLVWCWHKSPNEQVNHPDLRQEK